MLESPKTAIYYPKVLVYWNLKQKIDLLLVRHIRWIESFNIDFQELLADVKNGTQ